MKVPFNRANCSSRELELVREAAVGRRLQGGGDFSARCEAWLESRLGTQRALLTSSCTHALEMAALLLDLRPGDEVICPSYTFVSTANAFALRGAQVVFVDIDPATMTIDLDAVQAAITPRTRVVVPVHYAGYCCDMTRLMQLADAHGFWVVEDAAPALLATWRGRALGTIGHFGALSFHETKNLTSGGEGGALLVNDRRFLAAAEQIRQKGTDRDRFLRGDVFRYQWQSLGSSYLMSELQAAFLCAQLERTDELAMLRWQAWSCYAHAFAVGGAIEGLTQPLSGNNHNAHAWFMRLTGYAERDAVLAECRAAGIEVASHYEPLHRSVAGTRYGRFQGEDRHTTHCAATLLRLPLWAGMPNGMPGYVIGTVLSVLDRVVQR